VSYNNGLVVLLLILLILSADICCKCMAVFICAYYELCICFVCIEPEVLEEVSFINDLVKCVDGLAFH